MSKDIKPSRLWKWLMEVNTFVFLFTALLIGLVSGAVSLFLVWITTRR